MSVTCPPDSATARKRPSHHRGAGASPSILKDASQISSGGLSGDSSPSSSDASCHLDAPLVRAREKLEREATAVATPTSPASAPMGASSSGSSDLPRRGHRVSDADDDALVAAALLDLRKNCEPLVAVAAESLVRWHAHANRCKGLSRHDAEGDLNRDLTAALKSLIALPNSRSGDAVAFAQLLCCGSLPICEAFASLCCSATAATTCTEHFDAMSSQAALAIIQFLKSKRSQSDAAAREAALVALAGVSAAVSRRVPLPAPANTLALIVGFSAEHLDDLLSSIGGAALVSELVSHIGVASFGAAPTSASPSELRLVNSTLVAVVNAGVTAAFVSPLFSRVLVAVVEANTRHVPIEADHFVPVVQTALEGVDTLSLDENGSNVIAAITRDMSLGLRLRKQVVQLLPLLSRSEFGRRVSLALLDHSGKVTKNIALALLDDAAGGEAGLPSTVPEIVAMCLHPVAADVALAAANLSTGSTRLSLASVLGDWRPILAAVESPSAALSSLLAWLDVTPSCASSLAVKDFRMADVEVVVAISQVREVTAGLKTWITTTESRSKRLRQPVGICQQYFKDQLCRSAASCQLIHLDAAALDSSQPKDCCAHHGNAESRAAHCGSSIVIPIVMGELTPGSIVADAILRVPLEYFCVTAGLRTYMERDLGNGIPLESDLLCRQHRRCACHRPALCKYVHLCRDWCARVLSAPLPGAALPQLAMGAIGPAAEALQSAGELPEQPAVATLSTMATVAADAAATSTAAQRSTPRGNARHPRPSAAPRPRLERQNSASEATQHQKVESGSMSFHSPAAVSRQISEGFSLAPTTPAGDVSMRDIAAAASSSAAVSFEPVTPNVVRRYRDVNAAIGECGGASSIRRPHSVASSGRLTPVAVDLSRKGESWADMVEDDAQPAPSAAPHYIGPAVYPMPHFDAVRGSGDGGQCLDDEGSMRSTPSRGAAAAGGSGFVDGTHCGRVHGHERHLSTSTNGSHSVASSFLSHVNATAFVTARNLQRHQMRLSQQQQHTQPPSQPMVGRPIARIASDANIAGESPGFAAHATVLPKGCERRARRTPHREPTPTSTAGSCCSAPTWNPLQYGLSFIPPAPQPPNPQEFAQRVGIAPPSMASQTPRAARGTPRPAAHAKNDSSDSTLTAGTTSTTHQPYAAAVLLPPQYTAVDAALASPPVAASAHSSVNRVLMVDDSPPPRNNGAVVAAPPDDATTAAAAFGPAVLQSSGSSAGGSKPRSKTHKRTHANVGEVSSVPLVLPPQFAAAWAASAAAAAAAAMGLQLPLPLPPLPPPPQYPATTAPLGGFGISPFAAPPPPPPPPPSAAASPSIRRDAEDEEVNAGQPPCKYWRLGCCEKLTGCKFYHESQFMHKNLARIAKLQSSAPPAAS